MKVCRVCANSENLLRIRGAPSTICKRCHAAQQRAKYAKKPKVRKCCTCRKVKPSGEFSGNHCTHCVNSKPKFDWKFWLIFFACKKRSNGLYMARYHRIKNNPLVKAQRLAASKRRYLRIKDTPAFKANRRKVFRQWRLRNKARVTELDRKWKDANRVKIKARQPIYSQRYKQRHPERFFGEAARARFRKFTEFASDAYIRGLLCAGTNLSASDIPKDLVELKRAHLLLKRANKKSNL